MGGEGEGEARASVRARQRLDRARPQSTNGHPGLIGVAASRPIKRRLSAGGGVQGGRQTASVWLSLD